MAAVPEIVISDLAFPECLRLHAGQLWFSDVLAGQVLRLSASGAAEVVAEVQPTAGGIGWLPTGELLAVDGAARRVLRISSAGEKTVHADLSDRWQFSANDMLVLPDGTAWVGSYGFDPERDSPVESSMLRLAPTGSVSAELPGLVFPNGMGVIDAEHFVVAETFADRLAIVRDGDRPEVVQRVQLPKDSTPDGLAVDAKGDVWVALAYSDCVMRVSLKTGECARAIEIPGRGVYDCLFDGEHRLLVATSDKDESNVLVDRPGAILAFSV